MKEFIDVLAGIMLFLLLGIFLWLIEDVGISPDGSLVVLRALIFWLISVGVTIYVKVFADFAPLIALGLWLVCCKFIDVQSSESLGHGFLSSDWLQALIGALIVIIGYRRSLIRAIFNRHSS